MRPASTNPVPRVVTKDGSPRLTVKKALIQPMSPPNATARMIPRMPGTCQ
jgi:hypothetical protein